MSKTETPALTGEGAPLVQEVKQAMAGFVNEFKDLKAEVKTQLQQTEERLTMLDRKSTVAARPHLAASIEDGAPHQKAFDAYVRSGEDDGLRGLEIEAKSLSSAVNSDGGYLVDPQTAEMIKSVLNSTASIRSIASVVNVEANSFDVLIDHTDVGAGWADEASATTETATPSIDRISIPLHELSALPKASQRLLDDSAFDVEGWLAGRIADKFARAEAAAFIGGDGADKPKGILDHPAVDNDVWPEGSTFVLLDERVAQTSLLPSERRVARHFRIGPASRGYDDPSYEYLVEAFDGNGLRPYAPVHVSVQAASNEDTFSWIRRTRIEGDDWAGLDVPLGEENESYLIRVRANGALVREEIVAEPRWAYTAATKSADGLTGGYAVEIAQISATYGAGPAARIQVA